MYIFYKVSINYFPQISTEIKTGLQIVSSSLTHIPSFGDLKVYGGSRFPLFPPLQVVQESELGQCGAVAHHLLLSVQSCSWMPPKTPAEERNVTSISMEWCITDIWWTWYFAFGFQDLFVQYNILKTLTLVKLQSVQRDRYLSGSCTQLKQPKELQLYRFC